MTTRVIVSANHGPGGQTSVHVERRSSEGHFEKDPSPMILTGPNQWAEIWLPDGAQIVVSEPK